MSKQDMDKILYKNEEYELASEPLFLFLDKKGINFNAPRTNCDRGYYGKWEVKDNKLYLIDFKGYKSYEEIVKIEYLFPNETEVFASWFTGAFRICAGDALRLVHYGYDSRFTIEIGLRFENGVLVEDVLL